jgi:hypothetical protein
MRMQLLWLMLYGLCTESTPFARKLSNFVLFQKLNTLPPYKTSLNNSHAKETLIHMQAMDINEMAYLGEHQWA